MSDDGDWHGFPRYAKTTVRLARGMPVSRGDPDAERLAAEQELAAERVRDARDGPHRNTAAHRRWAKRHFCQACYNEWVRAGKPGEVMNSNGELHKTWRDILDE